MLHVSLGVRKLIYPFWDVVASLFPVTATRFKYRITTGKKLDLKNPRTFNEKLQWLKFYCYRNNPLVTQCVDKYAVRDYVRQCGCGELLNELLWVGESPNDIDWDSLPDKFVLKCNHWSGQNIICTDKKSLDKESATRQLAKWMKFEGGRTNVELIYHGVPRKIIAEKFIETEDGLPPKDYKIFCSYGEPKLVFVATERVGDSAKFDYYTTDWEWIPVTNNHPNAGATPRPDFLDEMFAHARALAKPFPMVRVDFYYEEHKVIFGELTFLHFGGSAQFIPEKYNLEFGELFPIHELNQ